jgi:hypothetical protein
MPSDLYDRVQRALRSGWIGFAPAASGSGGFVGLAEVAEDLDANGRPYSLVSHWRISPGFGPGWFPTHLTICNQRPGLPTSGMLGSYNPVVSLAGEL